MLKDGKNKKTSGGKNTNTKNANAYTKSISGQKTYKNENFKEGSNRDKSDNMIKDNNSYRKSTKVSGKTSGSKTQRDTSKKLDKTFKKPIVKTVPVKKSTGVAVGGELNSKQRANLRAIASSIEPIFQIGKDGVSDLQLDGIAGALNKRELIKITILKNSGLLAKDVLRQLSQSLDALAVSAIGSKVILYKRSNNDDIKHIEF